MSNQNMTESGPLPGRKGLVEVVVPCDFELLDVEAVLTLAADARYGCGSETQGPDDRWTGYVAKMREAVFRAAKIGVLTILDTDEVASKRFVSKGSYGKCYVGRAQFARFACEELRIRLLDGASTASLGRYSLEHAATAAVSDDKMADALLRRLKAAARSGALPVYAKGSLVPLRLADQTVVRSFGTVLWRDFNAWLADNEPNSHFRFPPPRDAYSLLVAQGNESMLSERTSLSKLSTRASAAEWAAKAVEIANEIARERRSRGQLQITARNVSAAVASRLGVTDGDRYWGRQGPRSKDNVRNFALKGWVCPPAKNAD